MTSIPKVVGMLSCGFILCLGLSHAAEAFYNKGGLAIEDELKTDHSFARQAWREAGKTHMHEMEGGQPKGRKMRNGEVLRIEGTNCFVQGQEVKEGRLRIDETTPKARSTSFGIQEDDNF